MHDFVIIVTSDNDWKKNMDFLTKLMKSLIKAAKEMKKTYQFVDFQL